MEHALPLQAADDLLRDHCLALTERIGVLDNLQTGIHDHDPALVQIGDHLQFRVDHAFICLCIAEIMVAEQMVSYDFQLVLNRGNTLFHGALLVIIQNTIFHEHAGNNTDHQYNDKDARPQAAQRKECLHLPLPLIMR